MKLTYRPDIDGLRAVAVLAVLFFHLDSKIFEGGYVGVDIFFVISGYLITSIILREITNDTFSFAQFYVRRFRRILPALFVVLVACTIACLVLWEPKRLIDYGQSLVANALFSSNILFYVEANFLEAGYFDAPLEQKLLLHTWSLGIEEQFYIFLPIYLIFVRKYGKQKYALWLSILAAISFGLSVFGLQFDKFATFYLLPTRAWELLIGSLLALSILPSIRTKLMGEVVALGGLIAIVASILLFSPSTNFPGMAALLPTIGSALLIYSGMEQRPLVSQFLSIKPLVFLGLISYSLYLWHWPLIAIFERFIMVELTSLQQLIMVAVIFLVSVLSYYFVETPFRRNLIFAKRTSMLLSSLAASVLFVIIGSVLILTEGLPNRDETFSIAQKIEDELSSQYLQNCDKSPYAENDLFNLCIIGKNDAQPEFLLWGDSHAGSISPAIDVAAQLSEKAGLVVSTSACLPLLGIERLGRDNCQAVNQQVLGFISENHSLETIILSARWTLGVSGTRYKSEYGEIVRLVDIYQQDPNAKIGIQNENIQIYPDKNFEGNIEPFTTGLTRTVDALLKLNKKVVLVRQIPEIGYNVPSNNVTAQLTNRNLNLIIAPSLSEYRNRNNAAHRILDKMAKKSNAVTILEPSSYLCSDSRCQVIVNDIPIYRDGHHLSTYGSLLLKPLFEQIWIVK